MNPDDIPIASSPAEAEQLISPQFEETMRLIEADKAAKKAEYDRYQAEKESTRTALPEEKKPLRLEYKVTGHCSCGAEPTTIMLDTDAGYFANAFCLLEQKQLLSIKVAKLPHVIMPEKKEKK